MAAVHTSQLSQTVEKLGWDREKRQNAWDMGHTLYTFCVQEYMERQGELKAERLQKKADKVRAGAEKLVQLADGIPDDAHIKDIEKLIVESNRQVDALKELSDEAEDVEMVDLANDWKAKLVLTSKKLKQQFMKAKEATGRPKPSFKSEDFSFRESSHWYAHQSPSANNWAKDVEEEWPFGSHRSRPHSRS